MESINKVIQAIKQELESLENGIGSRKDEINKAYNDAVAVAMASRKEALKESAQEEKQIETLKATLKSLGGSTPKPAKVKNAKPLKVPTEYYPSLPVTQKIAYILLSGSNKDKEEIAKYIARQENLDASTVAKKLSGILSQMKAKGHITATKQGRKDIYSLA